MSRWFLAVMISFAVSNLGAAEDPYKGWSVDKLKAEIGKLKQRIQELEKKEKDGEEDHLDGDYGMAGDGKPRLVDDFERDFPSMGGGWWAGCDQHNMGTTISPDPYRRLEGGSPLSKGFCAGIKGHLGPNEEPWAWATLTLGLGQSGGTADLTAFKAVRFQTLGDGKEHVVKLVKAAVTDYCDHQARFKTGPKWESVTIPFKDFKQPEWGIQVEHRFHDVKNIQFNPGLNDADFDFRIDDLEFLP